MKGGAGMASEEGKMTADKNSEKNNEVVIGRQENAKALKNPLCSHSKNAPDSFSGKDGTFLPEEEMYAFLDENDPRDALLIQALKQYDDEMLELFFSDSDDEKPVPLSDEGQENMKALLEQWFSQEKAEAVLQAEAENYDKTFHRWKQKRRIRILSCVRRWSIRVAAAVFVVAIFVVNADRSLAFKLPEVGFEAVVRDDYTQLSINSEDNAINSENDSFELIETTYILGKVLYDYELIKSIRTQRLNYDIYENLSGARYSYTQQLVTDNMDINTEFQVSDTINTLYGVAQYYTNGEISGLAWRYTHYLFKIEGALSLEELLELQESIQKSEE